MPRMRFKTCHVVTKTTSETLRDLAQQAVQEEAEREMQGGEEECKRNAEEKECDRVVTEGGGSVLCVCVCLPQA